MTEMQKIVESTLKVLNAVTSDLLVGTEEEILLTKYRGKYVAPGITIRDHLKSLRDGYCLEMRDGKLHLKSECDPRRFLQPC